MHPYALVENDPSQDRSRRGAHNPLCFPGWAGAATDSDKSQLKTADVNSMFPGGARAQPLPLPLGPAYNNSDFNSYVNVTFQMYTDQPASAFAVNQSLLSQLVNQLGQLYYPRGVLFEVSIS